jgi:hypothetical protein
MPDSPTMIAERRVQPPFRKTQLLQLLMLAALTLFAGSWLDRLPDRAELGKRGAILQLEPVKLEPNAFAPLRVAGSWRVTGEDQRVGGVSALAVDRGELLALTDSGAVLRFAKPRAGAAARAMIDELPGGPGDPRFKSKRDSEALARDPAGRGWWAAFENENELWLYDEQLGRPLRRIELGSRRWPVNLGIEAAVPAGGALLLLPERGDTVVELRTTSARTLAIANPAGRISDAVRLPSGELLVLNRRLTPLGFVNSLAVLQRHSSGYRFAERIGLRLGRLDNAEAIAAERMPDGRTRLWLMTDDNFQRPLRTLLVALDWTA